jgi:hypothetical protein
MNAAMNLVNYLYNTRHLVIQYTRSKLGNNPEVFEKDWSIAKSMEERLRARPLLVPLTQPTCTLTPTTPATRTLDAAPLEWLS